MANLPLAFAEILLGGVLATAGISGDSFSNIIKGEITMQPLDGASSSSSASSASASTSTTAAGSAGGGTITSASSYANRSEAGVTAKQFATMLLQAVGAPLTDANLQSVIDWEQKEGGAFLNTAHYNPLNTTYAEPGATSMNSVGVKSYTSWAQGLEATVATLDSHDYSDIIAALRSGKGLVGDIQGLSIWSGGGYSSVN